MAISKDKKQALVAEMSELLAEAKGTAVATYQGTSVADLQALRREAREAGVVIKFSWLLALVAKVKLSTQPMLLHWLACQARISWWPKWWHSCSRQYTTLPTHFRATFMRCSMASKTPKRLRNQAQHCTNVCTRQTITRVVILPHIIERNPSWQM